MKEFDTAPKYPNERTWRRLLSVLVLILYTGFVLLLR